MSWQQQGEQPWPQQQQGGAGYYQPVQQQQQNPWAQQQQQGHVYPVKKEPGPLTSPALLLFLELFILMCGIVVILLGFLLMTTDSNRMVYDSLDAVYKPAVEKMGYVYRRERYGWAFVGFGIWLGGVITITGAIGLVHFLMGKMGISGSPVKPFVVFFCGFSVACCLALVVCSSVGIHAENKICNTILYPDDSIRVCDRPYSTRNMLAIYSFLIIFALFIAIACLWAMTIFAKNKDVKKKRLPVPMH